MPAPHIEYFEGVAVGELVTSENTEFQTFVGESQTAGVGVPGLGIGSVGCQVAAADPVRGAGFYDQALAETPFGERLVVSMYVRVDEPFDTNPMAFTWVSEATTDIVPSIGVLTVAAQTLGGPDLSVATGSAVLPRGGWARIEWYMTRVPDTADVAVDVWIWSGVDLHSRDTAFAQGHLTGTYADAAGPMLFECWVVLGRHGLFPAPTAGALTVDSYGVDVNPWPPLVRLPVPGFFVVSGTVAGALVRTELVGQWNGSGYDEVEFLGTWNGEELTNQVEMVDTLWNETWTVNGPVGAPWTTSGSPSVSGGVVSGPATWSISRAGLTGNGRYAAIVPVRDNMEMRMWWNPAGTDSGLRLVDTGGSYYLGMLRQSGTERFVGVSVKPQGPAVFAFRLLGDRIDMFLDDVLVISGWLSAAELAELGSTFQVLGQDALLDLGAVRAEVLP
jgi:hypothetical protein